LKQPERFIYYRVADAAPAPRDAVLAMQRALCERHPRLQARLLCNATTWMEIYAQPGGVDDALLAEIENAASTALGSAIAGARHVETFEPCAS
jgi:hypothetical protein